MKPIREHIDAILKGWQLINNNRVFRNIRIGAERFLTLFWMLIGGIGPYRLMRYFYGATGAIHLVLITQSDMFSGLDIITQSIQGQYIIAFGMIAYAMILEKRNIFLLTIGSIGVCYYALMIGYGTVIGVIDLRGSLVVINLWCLAGAIMVASYSAFSDRQTQEKLEEQVATYETFKHHFDSVQRRNMILKELLVENNINLPKDY